MRIRTGLLALGVLLALTACSDDAAPRPTPSGTPSPSPTRKYTGFQSYTVTAAGPSVVVYDGPDGAERTRLANPQPSGAPLTFLLKHPEEGWLQVYLPVRPNGSTGWVRESAVRVEGNPWRVDVLTGRHRLRLVRDLELHAEFQVAIGKENTPTPGGIFYIKELLVPDDPRGFYGPYAYGLSGYSNVLTKFRGGEGVIGIHGTSQLDSIGRDASSGCIRMRNEDIRRLVDLLPLGTPVRILP